MAEAKTWKVRKTLNGGAWWVTLGDWAPGDASNIVGTFSTAARAEMVADALAQVGAVQIRLPSGAVVR